MNILVLVAGTNEPSNSNMLADAFVQGLEQLPGLTIEKRRLQDLNIKHFTVDFYDPQCSQEEDFCEVQELIEKADGLVIATPIWNFGVPAHLKNLIDRMGSFTLDASRSKGTLKGKPFYLIFTGGVPHAGWTMLMRKTTSFLPESLQYFGASYIGYHYEGRCTKGKGRFGLVVDERPKTLSSLREQGYKFANVVSTYAKTGKAPTRNRMRSKVLRWGETMLKKLS